MRKLLLTTTAIALACTMSAPAFAEFNERTIRVSNGINADHPVGNGIDAMQKCLDDKSGGKLKLTAFWGGALGGEPRIGGESPISACSTWRQIGSNSASSSCCARALTAMAARTVATRAATTR